MFTEELLKKRLVQSWLLISSYTGLQLVHSIRVCSVPGQRFSTVMLILNHTILLTGIFCDSCTYEEETLPQRHNKPCVSAARIGTFQILDYFGVSILYILVKQRLC